MPPDPRISEDLRDLFISKFYTKPSQGTLEALFQESQNRYFYFFSNFTLSCDWINKDNPKNAFRNYPEVFSGGNKQKLWKQLERLFFEERKKEKYITEFDSFVVSIFIVKYLESFELIDVENKL